MRKALADLYRKYGEKYWREHGGADVGATMALTFDRFAAADALDFQVIRRTADHFDIDVKRCRYAEFFEGASHCDFRYSREE